MNPARIGTRWTERQLIDEAFDAYVHWRDECGEVWRSYARWAGAPAREARTTFCAYRAALEREEHAARVYGRLVRRLEAEAADGVTTAASRFAVP